MRVTYEVTNIVETHLAAEYERYMPGHIADLLATGHFASATFSRNGNRYRTRYEAFSAESLDQYLTRDSEFLRQDFADHFPSGVVAEREIWDVIASLDP